MDLVFAVLCVLMGSKIPWISRITVGGCLLILTFLCFLKERTMENRWARGLFVLACLLGSAGILNMIF